MTMIRDTTKKAIVVTMDVDGSEEFRGTKSIFDDVEVIYGELVTTMSTKERNHILQ